MHNKIFPQKFYVSKYLHFQFTIIHDVVYVVSSSNNENKNEFESHLLRC